MLVVKCFTNLVARPNYGTMFYNLGEVQVSTSVWKHTFVLERHNSFTVPQVDNLTCSDVFESDTLRICNQMTVIFETAILVKNNLINATRMFKAATDTLLSNSKTIRSKRWVAKGDPFRIISFTNDMSLDDRGVINAINRNTQTINNALHSLNNQLQSDKNALLSFQVTNDKRFRNIWTALNSTFEDLNLLANEVRNMFHQANIRQGANERFYWYLHSLNFLNLHPLQILLDESKSYLNSIDMLINGRLPPYVITESMINEMVVYVKRILESNFSHYKLVYTDYRDYYKLNDFSIQVMDDLVYVTLHLPLQSYNSSYILFQVRSIPITLHAHTNTSSKIVTSEYFLVSSDSKYFIEANEMLDVCLTDKGHCCKKMLLPRKFSSPSCTAAIFMDDAKSVKNQCELKLYKHDTDNFVYVLDYENSTLFISTNDLSWAQICYEGGFQGIPRSIESCNLCSIQRQCNCAIIANTFLIPSDIRACKQNATFSVIKQHHLNLGTIIHAFDDNWPSRMKVFGESSSNTSLVNIPEPVQNFDKQFTKFEDKDYKYSIDLKKAITKLKNDKKTKIFIENMKLEHIPYWAQSKYRMGSEISFTLVSIMSLCSFIYILCILCKGKCSKYQSIPLLLSSFSRTSAFVLTEKPAPEPTITNEIIHSSLLDSMISVNHALSAVAFCLVLLIAFKCARLIYDLIYRCIKNDPETISVSCTLYFVIWDSKFNVVSIPLGIIPDRSKNLKRLDLNDQINPKVINFCFSSVFDWNSDTLSILMSDEEEFKIEGRVQISPWLSRKLTKILNAKYIIQLVVRDHKSSYCIIRRNYENVLDTVD